MARPAQAFDGWGRRVFLWRRPRPGLCILALLALSACGSKGFSIENAIDDSIHTGAITEIAAASTGDANQISDEITIRNAVSSALVEEIGEAGIGWANAHTGSRGSIRDIREREQNGALCRSFTASRESFSGVHLYSGEACFGVARTWTMRSFRRLD